MRPGWAIPCALLLALGCGRDDPRVRAIQIDTLAEAPGGPKSTAAVGDFLLENDHIKAVIEQGGRSSASLDVGGMLVDLDLNRPEAEFRAGRGLDQLGQIGAVANLQVADANNEPNVRITGSRRGAEITAAADSEPVVPIVLALAALVNQTFANNPSVNLYTEYELRPGERMVRVTTTVGFDVPFCRVMEGDACNEECDDVLYDDDCECESVPARCEAATVEAADALPDGEGRGLLDLMLGDLPRPLSSGLCDTEADCAGDELCVDVTSNLGGELRVCRSPDQRDAGMILGDMLIYSGDVNLFLTGPGFDHESDIRRLFDRGEDTLARPLELDGVFAAGDRVSYGYVAPAGRTLIPIFGGPFSMGAVAGASCATRDPGCLSGKLVRFERWISVGDGDATSAQKPIWDAQGRETGTVVGSVHWQRSGDAASGARVFAVRDPRDLPCSGDCASACEAIAAGEDLSTWSVGALFAANRCRSKSDTFIEGTSGIETFATTDVGTDPVRNGDYRLYLRPGRYVLVAVAEDWALSRPLPVSVTAGGTLRAPLALPDLGRIAYTIYDESGEPSPGRVSLGRCFPGDPCVDDGDCSGGDSCRAGSCACEVEAALPLELGGSHISDGVLARSQTASGSGEMSVLPGVYEIMVSRGPFYSAERRTVVVEPNRTTSVEAQLVPLIDRRGWSTADFHVHSRPSVDSGFPLEDRIESFRADDMDFLSSSDHDWLTNFEPLLEAVGMRQYLGSQVGVEVTTQNLGHFIGFPLRYVERSDGERVVNNGAPDWRGLSPQQIFDALRERAADGPFVVDVPHPFSYFGAYRLSPVTLEPEDSVLSFIDPLVAPDLFSGDFDAMELLNTDNFDLIRRPTISEVRAFSSARADLVNRLRAGEIELDEYNSLLYQLSVESTRGMLERTPGEQESALSGEGDDILCQCGSTGDCAPGLECNLETMTCQLPPLAADPTLPPPDGLCRSFRGVIDDWFMMLNRGVFRAGVSGSDVHGMIAGQFRTLLRTGATTAPHLDDRQVAQAVLDGRAVVTSGPMIDFEIDGHGLGSTVDSSDPVELAVRVESADWFDVDRIEIYRNGELIHWITGCGSEREAGADAHGHPCITDDARGFDEIIEDAPERDAWYVVIAMGIEGRPLSPVYPSKPLPRLGTGEIIQRIYDLIPALREFRSPQPPTLYPIFPYAITNPIWVDVDGGGFSPPLDPPSWCRSGDAGCR